MNFYAVGTTVAAAVTTVPSLSSSRNGTAAAAAESSNAPPAFQVENNPYALALAFVPLMTIFGNALVILAVCRDKSLRTVTNLLIMSLAISDLLVALCVMFFAVYYEWNSFVWNLGPTLCNLYIGADVACSTASILNLLAISIDRYIAISHPLAYCQIGTNSRAYVSIALVWGVSISVAIPLAFGANHIEREHECAFTNPVFMIGSSVLSFFLPCLAMIALYAVVFRRLRERESARTARKRHNALSGTETALIANALMGGARMARQIARSHLKDQLLLELSIQTSSFPTASRSEEEDEEDEDEEEEEDETTANWHRSNKRCLAAEQCQPKQRRPTLGLMMNGAMPFATAPTNPLQLPSNALTEAERRVRVWRRKRTLRLMRRCNTLPTTVMQRHTTKTTAKPQEAAQKPPKRTTMARGKSEVTEDQTITTLAKCQLQKKRDNAPKGAQNPKGDGEIDAKCDNNCADECELVENGAEGHVQLQTEAGEAPPPTAPIGWPGDGERPPPSPTPVHLCSSFGDELDECFPFIDQIEQQQQQHEDQNNNSNFQCALLNGDGPTSNAQLPDDTRPTAAADSADPSSSNGTTALKAHRRNGSRKGDTMRPMVSAKKQQQKKGAVEEKRCHQNGGETLANFGIQRTHSECHPTPVKRNTGKSMRRSSADERWWRTFCTACDAIDGKDEGNGSQFDGAINNLNNEDANHNDNSDGRNGNASLGAAAIDQRKNATAQTTKEAQFAAKNDAFSTGAALTLRNGGALLFHQQQRQKQRQKRPKHCGAMLAQLIQWTRGQRQRVIGRGIGMADGPRLVEVFESATTVGVFSSAVDHRHSKKASVRRSGNNRRSVRISSRSQQGRHDSTTDGNIHHRDQQHQLEDGDQSLAQWIGGVGESSAALSSSFRLLLEGGGAANAGANNCAFVDTDRRRNSCAISGSSVLEQFSGRGNGRDDDQSLAKAQNGTVPSWRSGGTGGCQRASTVTGVPKKKMSCASSTFSSSPLRHIRQAFRRSLVPIFEEGRKPSRALLKRATRQMRREQKATVTLAVVLAVFLCCWVPFFALHLSNAVCLLSGGGQCVHLLAMFLSTWLGYLNSSLNPLIYTVFDKRFRKAFRNLLGCAAGPRSAGTGGGGRRGTRPRG